MDNCKICGHKLLTASAELHSFEVDSEPYSDGVIEPVEEGDLIIDDCCVVVHILWCSECNEVRQSWIGDRDENPLSDGAISVR